MDKQYKRLDRFLCCCRLETGGYVFGWLGIVHCILSMILFILILVGLANNMVTDDVIQSLGYADQGSTPQDMTNTKQVFMIVSVLGIIGTIVYFVVAVMLIVGTNKQNPKQVLPAVIFFGVSSVMAIVGLFNFSFSAVLSVVYCIYAFIVTYSIYRLFQENENKPHETGVQQPVTTIA